MWPRDQSSFCHFKPFAFLHPICDGALTCSSIPLQWQNTTENRTLDGKWQDKNGTLIRDSVGHLDTSGQTVTDELFASFLAMCWAFGSTGCHVVSGRRKSTRGCFAQCSADRKGTHLGTMLLIFRVCVNNGFTYVNSKYDCLKTRPLCLQSVKRRLEQGPQWLVVARRLFLFLAGCFRQKRM